MGHCRSCTAHRVIGYTKVVDSLENLANGAVMLNHAVGIFSPRVEAWLIAVLGPHMRAKVHAGRI